MLQCTVERFPMQHVFSLKFCKSFKFSNKHRAIFRTGLQAFHEVPVGYRVPVGTTFVTPVLQQPAAKMVDPELLSSNYRQTLSVHKKNNKVLRRCCTIPTRNVMFVCFAFVLHTHMWAHSVLFSDVLLLRYCEVSHIPHVWLYYILIIILKCCQHVLFIICVFLLSESISKHLNQYWI